MPCLLHSLQEVRCGSRLKHVSPAPQSILIPWRSKLYRSLPAEPVEDPDSGLLGFVGPEGLIGLLALPPMVDPLPEGEFADGLLLKPDEPDPDDAPDEGLVGAVVLSPALPGAVPAPPALEPPPIAAPPPAVPPAAPPPAPPVPPCAWTAGANALSAKVRAPPIRMLDARFRFCISKSSSYLRRGNGLSSFPGRYSESRQPFI
jgi:hypothetical protein